MNVGGDRLVQAVEELRQAAGENDFNSGPEWSARVGKALAEVEHVLRQHPEDIVPVDNTRINQDRALLPSPGIERWAEGLRQKLDDLAEEIDALRAELLCGGIQAQSVGFAERVRSLVRALERHERDEIDIVQESFTTDIGSGD
jgi:hypothetical protein